MEEIRILIHEDEWLQFPKRKRERIKKLLTNMYGWDVSELEEIEREHEERLLRDFLNLPWVKKKKEEGEDHGRN